ncbi:MAG: ergothioneine biosynthesis protein EgtC [Cyanobacteria bacterium P01_C01_bin.120]
MCRLLGYVGSAITLESLILKPPHSLMVQSYAPQELEVALLNADGFGLGWYHAMQPQPPFTYRSVMPMWNDVNLEPLCRYIKTGCAVAYVRSATPGQGVDLMNCQPFQLGNVLFTHNGYIKQFREKLYRPMRQLMSDRAYAAVHGSTDSEHIWGLILTALEQPDTSLAAALAKALEQLGALAQKYDVPMAANVLLSDGQKLVGARLAFQSRPPSLYWLRGVPQFPQAVIIASEPLFDGPWTAVEASSLFTVTADCDLQFSPLICP